MISKKTKHLLRSGMGLLCAVIIAFISSPVYAAPSSKELENKTNELQNNLDSLNSELASLGQELDDTSSQIESLSAEVEKSKLDLAAAKLNEDAQYASMKDRIKFMYEGGSVSLINILFSSENMADFLNKAEYVSTISSYDRQMLDEIQAIRSNIEQKQADLEEKQKELASLQKDLSEKQNTLNEKIASASGELDDYNAQLERAKAAEAALKTAQDNSVSGSISGGSGGNTSSGGSSGNGGVVNVPSVPADTSDVALLAAILQCEAGGSYDGMLAVGTVIMNRVASPSYPNSISGVIYQSGQFSPAGSGWLNQVLANGPSASAYSAAQAILAGTRHADVINCYSFRAAWAWDGAGVNIGGNVFF